MNTKVITVALFSVAGIGLAYLGVTSLSRYGVLQGRDSVAVGERGGFIIVTVDVARIFNAQREAAGALFQGDPNAATTLAQVGHLAEETIRAVAGPNAIILIKQAVVNPSEDLTPDITDTVLDRLGLPKTAMTIDPMNKSYSYGGTNMSESNLGEVLDAPARARMEATMRERQAESDRSQNELVP